MTAVQLAAELHDLHYRYEKLFERVALSREPILTDNPLAERLLGRLHKAGAAAWDVARSYGNCEDHPFCRQRRHPPRASNTPDGDSRR